MGAETQRAADEPDRGIGCILDGKRHYQASGPATHFTGRSAAAGLAETTSRASALFYGFLPQAVDFPDSLAVAGTTSHRSPIQIS